MKEHFFKDLKRLRPGSAAFALVLSWTLMACGGDSAVESVNNTVPPKPDPINKGDDLEVNKGTYALQVKSGEEYFQTLLILTGLASDDRYRRADGSLAGNNQTLRSLYLAARPSLPTSSNPGAMNPGHVKEIVGLANAFCRTIVFSNDERKNLFEGSETFGQELAPRIDFLFEDPEEVPALLEEMVRGFTDAYWVGSIALANSGRELPFALTSISEIKSLLGEMGLVMIEDIPPSLTGNPYITRTRQLTQTLMILACTHVLASAYVYLH